VSNAVALISRICETHASGSDMGKTNRNWYSTLFTCAVLLHSVSGLGQTPAHSEGTEFWIGFMQNGYGAQARNIIISAEQATTGIVEAPLQGWSQTFSVAANSTTTVSVPVSLESQGSEVVSNKGIHVIAQDTINVFAESSQSFTGDATSVLSIANLGTDYIISAAEGLPGFANFYKSEFVVIAIEDNTEIEITPTEPTAAGRPAGVPFTVILNAGESYQVHASLADMDLTGSRVVGTAASGECRPFAVFSGSMCANLPNGCTACDHLYVHLAPVSKWGSRYFTFDPDLILEYAYRVIARDNNTIISVDGVNTVTLNAGDWHNVFNATGAHCIEGSNPISVTQLFKGYTCAGSNGDPSILELNADGQLIRATQFETLGSTQVSAHRLAVISDVAFTSNVSVDGNPIPSASFTPYSSCSNYAIAYMNLAPGQHDIDAPHGVIAYAYGVGIGESYLYTLGSSTTATLPMSDTTFCQSGSVDLIAPPNFIEPYWTLQSAPNNTLATSQVYSITPTTSDIYTAWGFLYASGCLVSQDYYVEIDAPSTLTLSAVPSTLCQNGQTQLNVTAGTPPPSVIINWSPGHLLNDSTIPNPIANITETTWFTVEFESISGCSSSIDSVLVELALPKVLDVEVTVNEDSICSGSATTLSAMIEQEIIADGFNVLNNALWSNILGGTPSMDCGSVLGNALYFNGSGQRTAQTNGFDLSNGGHVRFHLKIGTGVAPCDNAEPGEDVVLEYSTNGGVTWNTWVGSTFDEASFPVFTFVDLALPPAAFSANTHLRLRQLSNSGVGQDNWAIDDISISAFSANNLNLTWSPSASVSNPTSATTQASPAVSTWYELLVDNNTTGCAVTDSIFVSVGSTFNLSVPNDTSLCDLAPVQLNATPSAGSGHTFTWSPNNATLSAINIANPIANTTATETYSVSAVSDHGCTANEQVAVTLDQVQSAFITASDSALCAGQSTNLTATIVGSSTGLTYAWTPAGIMNDPAISNPIASPTNNTTASVTVTDIASGCTYSDNLDIAVVNLNLDLGADTVICSSVGLVLNASHTAPNPTFTWNGGVNLNNNSIADPEVLLNGTNTYSVTLVDAAGCSATDQITVTVPFDNLTPLPDTVFCDGDSVLLDATHPNSTYLWNGSDPSPSIFVSAGGTQTVQLTNITSGCQASYSLNVTMHPVPNVNLGIDTTLCAGQNITLDAANSGATFLWSTNAQTQTINVGVAGTYWVDVTNATGCSTRDSIVVDVESLPVLNLQDSTLCLGESLVLDATSPNASYSWSTSETTPTISVTTSGIYSVTVTNAAGCSSTQSVNITFVPFPVVFLGPDTVLCSGQALTLNGGDPAFAHTWSTGSNATSINPTTSGIYWVDVANGSCVTRDSIGVVFNALPVDDLFDVNSCEGSAVALSAGNIGSSYAWSTNETTESIEVSTSGTYTVTVTTPLNCMSTFDAVVNFEAPPAVELGNDTTLCEGEILVLSSGNPGADNDWSTGEISETITVSSTGTHSVLVSTTVCEARDSIQVTFNPSPIPSTPSELLTCLDESPGYVVIDAGNSGSAFDWSTGEQTQVILANAYGWYFVNITNSFDCSVSDSVQVTEFCPSTIFVPNTFSPNGDGINDIFMPVGNNIVELEMFVFDRWGTLLFHTDDPTQGWDGTYQGEIVKEEVYSWRMIYKLLDDFDSTVVGFKQESIGHITVIK